jgi:hypothetical protein
MSFNLTFLDAEPGFSKDYQPWFNHEFINYYTIQGLGWVKQLPKVQVLDNPNFNDWSLGPNHIDLYKESSHSARTLSNGEDMDPAIRNGDFLEGFNHDILKAIVVEPWKILTLYCIEPDMQLDIGILGGSVQNEKQKLMGGSHAYRHMKLKMFGFNMGEPQKCIDYFFSAAKRAYQMGNQYWAWRFLARGSHYLADLGHPFHVELDLVRDFFQMVKNFHQFIKLQSATHTSHESYVQQRFREDYQQFPEALRRGAERSQRDNKSVWSELPSYIKFARSQMKPLHAKILETFGEDLVNAYNIMDEHPEIDLSKRTMFATREALRVIFKDPSIPSFKFFDSVTAQLLENVGFMLGLYFNEFRKQLI